MNKTSISIFIFKLITTTSFAQTNNNDTFYKDSKAIIIKSKKPLDTHLKFKSNIDDSSYSVKVWDIKPPKSLDFSNYEYKKMFITATREGVKKEGVNFSGHFCFVYWGCGSSCKLSAVVDMQTGKVYNGVASEIGYTFKKGSKLLIVNPPEDSLGWYDNNIFWQQPAQYIWTGKKFDKL